MFLRENEEGRRVAPHLKRGETVLDLGAGTGLMSSWLREKVGVRPTLTDIVSYGNREKSLPFIEQRDPLHVPVEDGAFDVVLLMFVFHHMDRYEDQERLLDEAIRVARRRVIITEDTPGSGPDRVFNKLWDWVLNLRHGVPTPFTFRGVPQWVDVFEERDVSIGHVETYRPMWPTLKTYPHTVFVLDP